MSSTRPDRDVPAMSRRRKLLLPGGVSLLEMVLAVSMLGALTSAILEWQAFEAARAQAVGSARQLVGLAHLIQDYASLQPRHYHLANHLDRDMDIDNSGKETFGATYAPPAGGLMAGRWPKRFADLRAVTPESFSEYIVLPADPDGEGEEDVRVFQILGSEDITLTEGVMGTTRLRVGGIALHSRASLRLMALLLRRQGLAARVEEHSIDDKVASLTLTLTLMPQSSLYPPPSDKVEVDFAYGTDLVVAGVVATDVKAHEAMIPYVHAPFDFTMRSDDPAVERAVEAVAGRGTGVDEATAKPVLDGMRQLGGYSGFFYDHCAGSVSSAGLDIIGGDVQVRKCSDKLPGSSLYSQFRVVGARSGVWGGGNSGPAKTGILRIPTRDELLPQDSGPWGGEKNPHLLADRKSLVCTSCGQSGQASDSYYNMDSFGHNESASFATNAIVVSANLPGVPWTGDYPQGSANWFTSENRKGPAFSSNRPYRVAWLQEDPPSPALAPGRPSVRWGFVNPTNSMQMDSCGKGHNFADAIGVLYKAGSASSYSRFFSVPYGITRYDFKAVPSSRSGGWDRCKWQMPLWEIPTTTSAGSEDVKRTIWAFQVERPNDNSKIKYPSRMIASDGGLAYTEDQVQGMPLLGKPGGRTPGEYELGGRAFGDRSMTRLFQIEYMLDALGFSPRTDEDWKTEIGACTQTSLPDRVAMPRVGLLKFAGGRWQGGTGSLRAEIASDLAGYLSEGQLATTGPDSDEIADYLSGAHPTLHTDSCRPNRISAYIEDYRYFNGLNAAQVKSLESRLWASTGHIADYSRIFHFNRSYYPSPGPT